MHRIDRTPVGPPSPIKGLTHGWLIERTHDHRVDGVGEGAPRRFLQIGTGQWCSAEYATLFQLRRTAIAYAREFGLLVDREIQVVRFGP